MNLIPLVEMILMEQPYSLNRKNDLKGINIITLLIIGCLFSHLDANNTFHASSTLPFLKCNRANA